jgi:general secretion pathway protein F
MLSKVREKVNEGSRRSPTRWRTTPKCSTTLYVISMVRAGERTGALGTVLKRLVEVRRRGGQAPGTDCLARWPTRCSWRSSASGLIIVIFVGVLPQMRTMFDLVHRQGKGDAALPLDHARGVLHRRHAVVGWGWLLPVLVVGARVLPSGRWISHRRPAATRFDNWKLTIPLFGRMNRMVAVSRFCRTLGTLLLSGVPIVTALGIVRDVVGNTIIADAVQAGSRCPSRRASPSPARSRRASQFPPMVIHMIQVGEKHGRARADAQPHRRQLRVRGREHGQEARCRCSGPSR